MNNWKIWAVSIVLFIVTLWLFWPATGYGFLNFDDDRYVSGNAMVLNGLTAQGVQWAVTTVYEDYWLPFLWLSFMADAELFGPGPYGFHLTNVLLHAINAVLLFWALHLLTGSCWRSAFVAALFAFHPLRVESVAWIASRKDVLSGLFFMLGLLAYVRYSRKPSSGGLYLLSGLLLFGLLSKAIMLVFPFVLLLLDYWPMREAGDPWVKGAWSKWRPLFEEKLFLVYLAVIFAVINLYTHVAGTGRDVSVSLLTRIGLIFPNYWAYLSKFFWPARLTILYPESNVVHWPLSLVALAGLVLLTLLALRFRKAAPYVLVGWAWFLLTLFPVIRGVRLGLADYANRFLYLPSIGFGMAITWGVVDLLRRNRLAKIMLCIVGVAVLAVCVWLTRINLPFWKNPVSVFERAVKYAPDHFLINNNYGEALLRDGQTEKALYHFERATEILPDATTFMANSGMALMLLDRTDEALGRVGRALWTQDPHCPFLNLVMGLTLIESGTASNAVPFIQRALNHPEAIPTWRMELIRAYMESGQSEAASNELARIGSEITPALGSLQGMSVYYLGLWSQGHGKRAWTFFERAMDHYTNNALVLNNIAWFLATDPPVSAPEGEALRLAQQAVGLAPARHPGILDTMAAAYAAEGRFDEAVASAEEARSLAFLSGDEKKAEEIGVRIRAYRGGKAWGRSGPVERRVRGRNR